jgi:hypothetical protein
LKSFALVIYIEKLIKDTLHLYLNSSPASSPIGEEIAGGVTVFSSHDGKQRLDIKPTSGSLRFII